MKNTIKNNLQKEETIIEWEVVQTERSVKLKANGKTILSVADLGGACIYAEALRHLGFEVGVY